MHQYKTVTRILLILSIFKLVFATPVVREIYDAHDDVVVPVVVPVRNVAAMLKERGQTESDTPPPSSSTPPPDGSAPSHSSPLLPDGSMPSDGPAPLHEPPSTSGGPAALAVSSAPDEIVPASDQPPVPVQSTSTPQHDMLATGSPSQDWRDKQAAEAEMRRFGNVAKVVVVGTTILVIIGGLLWHHRHDLRRRTDDLDCSAAKGSLHPCLDYQSKDHLQD